jgi:hypothetical protein
LPLAFGFYLFVEHPIPENITPEEAMRILGQAFSDPRI